MSSHMSVQCPICGKAMDGMHPYGRDSHCCSKDCNQEWEWRRTLAIMGKPYEPDPRKLSDNLPVTYWAGERVAQASPTFSEAEELAIRTLMGMQELNRKQILQQALRLYQQHIYRLRDGETCTWSGDAQRVAEFTGHTPPL